jgi:RNA polymerase sigma factor (sigma-70 family)
MATPIPDTDNTLVSLAMQGCESSFRGLFDRYYHAIHSYVWKMCGDATTAEDIAQQTFIKIASKLHTYQPRDQFKAWIYRIALNTTRDHLRAALRYRKKLEQYETPQSESQPDLLKYELLADTLKKLPENTQETILLVFAEGFTQKEAAQILQCPEGTVAWRISEARKILKR